VETPDECFLCGPEEEISDPDAILNSDGLTCESAAELARHVFDETVCEGNVKPNVDFCCRPKPTNMPVDATATVAPTAVTTDVAPTAVPTDVAPTAVPTDVAPTAVPTESSAPVSKFVVPLTLGMLMVGSMMMMFA
jgi:hypothetical protein